MTLTLWEEEEVEKSSTWFWGQREERAGDGIVPGLEARGGMGKHGELKGAECAEEQKSWRDQGRRGGGIMPHQSYGSELK